MRRSVSTDSGQHHARRRRQPPSPTSSDGLPSPASPPCDPQRRHLTTPRTKQRSITHLSELVRRQKEELLPHRQRSDVDSSSGEATDVPPSPKPPVECRRIQVAVRCRPRQSRRPFIPHVRSDDGTHVSDDNRVDYDDEEEDKTTDSVIEYDFPDSIHSGRHPAVSIPSHVLALGGRGPRRRFEFDHVFPPHKQQRDIYKACVGDAIDGVLHVAERSLVDPMISFTNAAHATILAYGQTGTGKTYTMGMLQHADPATDHHEHGLIPRAVHHILSRLDTINASQQDGVQLVASMSFLQIYLETIQDLLQPSSTRRSSVTNSNSQQATPGLQVRLDPVTNMFYVPGLSEVPIESVQDAGTLLEQATHSRVLASTARNRTSSRSHTLLTISVARGHVGADPVDATTTPRCTVSFVDLAGSERVEGALHFLHATRRRQELRIREAKFINRSLSALGSVITVLAEQETPSKRGGSPVVNLQTLGRRKPHIRFRDSQLTKLLQSRLIDGSGRLVLIATIDDRAANLTETLSTLKFASQCRRVDLSQSSRALAAVNAKQSLVKQVFDEMKVVYEEREAALRREYDGRIAALEQQLRDASSSSQAGKASYVALCSLVDLARQRSDSIPTAPHPDVGSFHQDADAVKYVAELYRELKRALSVAPDRRRSASAVAAKKTTDSLPQAPQRLEHDTACDRSAASMSMSTTVVRHEEATFETIARHLFGCGMLDHIEVSSDEESNGSCFSQMH